MGKAARARREAGRLAPTSSQGNEHVLLFPDHLCDRHRRHCRSRRYSDRHRRDRPRAARGDQKVIGASPRSATSDRSPPPSTSKYRSFFVYPIAALFSE
ncbi:unnamed protein product, partial [Mesorhabditis spiculigera]